MKRMIALVLILALAPMAGAAAQTLRVGMECDYAPFNWMQAEPSDTAVPVESGGYADGYDVQIAVLIAEALGRELVIVRTDWDTLPVSLTTGGIDAIIAGMSPTAERAESIDFSDAYYESDLVIVVRKDSPYAAAQTLADLSGARIAGQRSTFHDTVIDQIPGVRRQTPMPDFPTMIVAVTAGTIDGYVSEEPGALAAVFANPDLTFITFAEGQGFVASRLDLSIAVGLQQGSDLVEPINAALAALDEEAREQMMIDAILRQPLNQ